LGGRFREGFSSGGGVQEEGDLRFHARGFKNRKWCWRGSEIFSKKDKVYSIFWGIMKKREKGV